MICPSCQGTGRGYVAFPALSCNGHHIPALYDRCYECQGSGIVSCCDTAGAAPQVSAEDNWQKYINSQLAGTIRKDETALYAKIVELEKRIGELERK